MLGTAWCKSVKKQTFVVKWRPENIWVSENHSVMSDSLRHHGLYGPWNSPGLNTGVGSCFLLQGIFPTQGSNPHLPHCRRILYQLSHQGSLRQAYLILHRIFFFFLYLSVLWVSSNFYSFRTSIQLSIWTQAFLHRNIGIFTFVGE